jgi:tetratricopeptide (TPR) repeat protein
MSDILKSETGEALLTPGASIGRFILREKLGVGGMGEVYRADDTKLNRPVAIKRMSSAMRTDPEYRRNFIKEAERASQLNDPHIAAIYDILEEHDEMFLVMELVEGLNLRQLLTRETKLKDFLGVAIQAAEGLSSAHTRGIVHCDIKPENIMFSSSGVVKILDFGVARRLTSTVGTMTPFTTATVRLSGTPGYMAPEVMLDEVPDQRSDIFSLGVVFYEALSGVHPFRKRTVFETADSVLHSEPPSLDSMGVQPQLSSIIAKMMAKESTQRYQSAEEVVRDLQNFTGTARTETLLRSAAREDVRRQKAPGFSLLMRRKKALIAALALLFAVVIGVGLAVRQFTRISRALGISKAPQIAVLSFQSIGGNAPDQAFADGLSDVITSELTQLTDRYALQVVPATELRSARVNSVATAKQQFGVDTVVEGSIQPVANMVRATYSIVDARTGRLVKSGSISVFKGDPFGLQDQLADDIVQALGVNLRDSKRGRLAARGTTASAAYDGYLQGLGYLENYENNENIELAIASFNRALKYDSSYALAYAGLGAAYWHQYDELKTTSSLTDAMLACQRSLAIDSDLPEGHRCLGKVYTSTGQTAEAAHELELAVAKRPTDDDSVRALGRAYEQMKQYDKAEETYRQAINLRPHYWAGYAWFGSYYFRRGQFEKALEMFQHIIAVVPDNYRGYSNTGGVYIIQGNFAAAIEQFEHSVRIQPTYEGYSNLGTAYFFQRRFSEAVGANLQAVKLRGDDYVAWGNLGDSQYFAPKQRELSDESYRKAIALAAEALKVNPKDSYALGSTAMYYAMLNDREKADDYLRKATELKPGGPDIWWQASVVCSQFGRTDETLSALQSALAAGFSSTFIKSAPYFDRLQSDARFRQLIQSAERLEKH